MLDKRISGQECDVGIRERSGQTSRSSKCQIDDVNLLLPTEVQVRALIVVMLFVNKNVKISLFVTF